MGVKADCKSSKSMRRMDVEVSAAPVPVGEQLLSHRNDEWSLYLSLCGSYTMSPSRLSAVSDLKTYYVVVQAFLIKGSVM